MMTVTRPNHVETLLVQTRTRVRGSRDCHSHHLPWKRQVQGRLLSITDVVQSGCGSMADVLFVVVVQVNFDVLVFVNCAVQKKIDVNVTNLCGKI